MSPLQPIRSFLAGVSVGIDKKFERMDQVMLDHNLLTMGSEVSYEELMFFTEESTIPAT
jgi:hypothetical protein